LPPGGSSERLESWKEIAGYLKRDVTTVQRWEKREAMPVHRHLHDRLGTVYAFRNELDEWLARRAPSPASEPAELTNPPATSLPRDAQPHVAPFPWRSALKISLLLAVAAAFGIGIWSLMAPRTPPLLTDALERAGYHVVTDFDGIEQAAALSPDGRLVTFVSDREGQLDVWVTQLGTGQFHNLTRGRVRELINPSVRTLGFTPDGTSVTFWARGVAGSTSSEIDIWAIPTFGGEPRPYLEGVAEFEWARDGSRLVYHTPGPGDPMFVREGPSPGADRGIFSAPTGMHAHFPTWSTDAAFIYFVQGSLPDAMDLYRILPSGGGLERLTHHDAGVSHPVVLDDNTVVYLVRDKDTLGARLYALDVARRSSRSLHTGFDRYTSLSASADAKKLVATLANPKGTLWTASLATGEPTTVVRPLALSTGRGSSPRLGPGFMLYVARKGASDVIWKLKDDAAVEVWSTPDDSQIVGGPELDDTGTRIAVAVESGDKTRLYAMNADGTNARLVTESLSLDGSPAWAPGGQSLIAAAIVNGTPHLFRISLEGVATPIVTRFATDPSAAPDGRLIVYTGADIGTKFEVKGSSIDGHDVPIPNITLTRGSRRLRFIDDGRSLVFMRGDIRHKDLWAVNLQSGEERRLTNLPPDFHSRDFDVSPDGRAVVFERLQEHSDIVLIDLGSK
jgi:Tol biopolymer transport system component